jgi:hypothetical protein
MDHQAHLDARLDHFARRAGSIVADRMADARSHLILGDLNLADRRLLDVADALATADGRGVIGDVAESAYLDAFRLIPHDPEVHAEHWRSPTPEGRAAARMAAADARPDIAAAVDRAREALPLIVGDRDAIDAWHEEHRAAVTRRAATAISDVQVETFYAVGHARHRPELLGDAP